MSKKTKVLMAVLTNLSFLSAVTILTGLPIKDPVHLTLTLLGEGIAILGSWEIFK
jgi:hypothetical protein